MPGNFTNFTVGATTPVAITASVVGCNATLAEANNGTTASWILYHAVPPTTSGAAVPSAVGKLIAAGGSYAFSKTMTFPMPYAPGEIICFAKASTGTLTLQLDESGS